MSRSVAIYCRGKAVRAKTGTIRGVKALSGLVQRPDGRIFVFSILMQARPGGRE